MDESLKRRKEEESTSRDIRQTFVTAAGEAARDGAREDSEGHRSLPLIIHLEQTPPSAFIHLHPPPSTNTHSGRTCSWLHFWVLGATLLNFQLQLLVQKTLSGEGSFVSAHRGGNRAKFSSFFFLFFFGCWYFFLFSCARLSEQLLRHFSEKLLFFVQFCKNSDKSCFRSRTVWN